MSYLLLQAALRSDQHINKDPTGEPRGKVLLFLYSSTPPCLRRNRGQSGRGTGVVRAE